MLINRLQSLETGDVIQDFQVDIPEYYQEEAKVISEFIGEEFYKSLQPLDSVIPISVDNLAQMYLNRNWKANLTVIG